jgi:threonine/homoserine/homoserine lactone efflux protein
MLNYVGNTLDIFSILALILGVGYLIWGGIYTFQDTKNQKNEKSVLQLKGARVGE